MTSHLGFGIFALYVTLVSLVRILLGQGMPTTGEAGQIWERRHRLLPVFLFNVATPLVVGIVFITRGIVGQEASSITLYDAVPQQHIYQHIISATEMARRTELKAEILLAAEWRDPNLRWSRVNLIP